MEEPLIFRDLLWYITSYWFIPSTDCISDPKKGTGTQVLGVNESSEGIPTKSEGLKQFLLAQYLI